MEIIVDLMHTICEWELSYEAAGRANKASHFVPRRELTSFILAVSFLKKVLFFGGAQRKHLRRNRMQRHIERYADSHKSYSGSSNVYDAHSQCI